MEPDSIDMNLLDLYEIRSVRTLVPMGGEQLLVEWYCSRCRTASTSVKDVDLEQTGLTLAELAETVREHEVEAHNG